METLDDLDHAIGAAISTLWFKGEPEDNERVLAISKSGKASMTVYNDVQKVYYFENDKTFINGSDVEKWARI